MNSPSPATASPAASIANRAWYRELTPYHWFVFIVASAAWSFDCLDQRLFSLARNPALEYLMAPETPAEMARVQETGKRVTALFLVGWGVGGVLFGALGDRYGRARMLTITVLLYSGFTGLTCFSQSAADFAFYRFMTGVGVGGVFGLAVALIAETLSDTARVGALGTLQILSTIGNLAAAGFNSLFNYLAGPTQAWRWMFAVGALPALLVILIARYLHEPERWLRLKETGQLPTGNILAPYVGLISDRHWRKNLIVGTIIASTGVIGMWAIAEYAVDLQRFVFNQHYGREILASSDAAQALTDADVTKALSDNPELAKQVKSLTTTAITKAYLLYMIGAAVGMWAFTRVTMLVGRRASFAIGFLASLATTLAVYGLMNSPADAYWMTPLMGAAHLATFAGFAIYLPELFPSRLRSSGASFCYNFGRFAAAAGSLISAELATRAFGHLGSPLKERYSAMTMCVIFLMGIAILPWAPETKDKPLPE